jgi:hypothetical protein
MALMRGRRRNAFGVFVISLVLFAVQAGLWVRSTAHARSETDKQNVEGQHPPNEIPGILATCLLVVAGVIASIPQSAVRNRETP